MGKASFGACLEDSLSRIDILSEGSRILSSEGGLPRNTLETSSRGADLEYAIAREALAPDCMSETDSRIQVEEVCPCFFAKISRAPASADTVERMRSIIGVSAAS